MREQPIERIVDARAGQRRVIFWLKCNHKVSVTELAVADNPDLMRQTVLACPFCPDPDPEELQQSKPAHQLYKEAGEPDFI